MMEEYRASVGEIQSVDAPGMNPVDAGRIRFPGGYLTNVCFTRFDRRKYGTQMAAARNARPMLPVS